MKKKISVLLVERDPMLLFLESNFIERIESLRVCGKVDSLYALEQHLHSSSDFPDLIVLEPFLPYNSMREVMTLLRSEKRRAEVIVVSLCSESAVIAEACAQGIFDYIVKPFAIERLRQSLINFERHFLNLAALSETMSQTQIDRVFRQRTIADQSLFRDPPKNLSEETALHILTTLHRSKSPLSAEEVGRNAGLAKSTSRRYLVYLVDQELAGYREEQGATGRPLTRYFPLLFKRCGLHF